MATRSGIGIMNPNTGSIKAIYCHWDGYLEHNGSLLNKHYSASPKVNNLIALGDLSSLRPEIGEAHPFGHFGSEMSQEEYDEKFGDMCTFYTRDRGEKCPYRVFNTRKEFVNGIDGEYFYLFVYDTDQQGGKWFYKNYKDTAWKNLATALAKLDEKECA
jgi:hypothetical protein